MLYDSQFRGMIENNNSFSNQKKENLHAWLGGYYLRKFDPITFDDFWENPFGFVGENKRSRLRASVRLGGYMLLYLFLPSSVANKNQTLKNKRDFAISKAHSIKSELDLSYQELQGLIRDGLIEQYGATPEMLIKDIAINSNKNGINAIPVGLLQFAYKMYSLIWSVIFSIIRKRKGATKEDFLENAPSAYDFDPLACNALMDMGFTLQELNQAGKCIPSENSNIPDQYTNGMNQYGGSTPTLLDKILNFKILNIHWYYWGLGIGGAYVILDED